MITVERTVNNVNKIGYLVDFEYESFKELAECISNYKNWDDFDFEYNNDDILQVWDYNNDDDIIKVYIIENEDE